MEDFIFPKTFDEWRHTITAKGGIELTPSYVSERIAILKNEKIQVHKTLSNYTVKNITSK